MISGGEVTSVMATRSRGGPAAGALPLPATGAAGGGKQDAVAVSPRAATMAHWLSALRGLPEVRSARVDAAKARLASGTKVPAADVARQMLRRSLSDRIGGAGG